MGLFVERVAPDEGALRNVIHETLLADPGSAGDADKVNLHMRAAKQAAKGTKVVKWNRILVALLIGGGLILVGIVIAAYSDNWTADQALKAATTTGYVAPKSSLSAIATSLIALGSAWSTGLVGAVLSDSASS